MRIFLFVFWGLSCFLFGCWINYNPVGVVEIKNPTSYLLKEEGIYQDLNISVFVVGDEIKVHSLKDKDDLILLNVRNVSTIIVKKDR